MMKRILLAILFIFATCVLPALAIEKVKIGDLYYYLNPDDRTAEVTSANKNITSVDIPSTVEYNSTIYSVTSIDDLAFYDCISLTSITIPNSITSIGGKAFCGCSSLEHIVIPNSVTNIGSEAFARCDKINFPIYNTHCFAYLPPSHKGMYTIPEGIASIAGGAFSGCKSLSSVEIPNSVTSIGWYVFSGCSSLKYIDIPNSVTSIGGDAFSGCSYLKYINIPNSVTSIKANTFSMCKSLSSVEIPNSITCIYRYAFCYCSSLKHIRIPNSVTRIEENAFWECRNLKEIRYPQGLDLSKAGIPSSTKLIAYDPTKSSTSTAATASSRSTSATNSATTSRAAVSSTTSQSTTHAQSSYTKPTTSTVRPTCTILYPSDKNTYTYYSKSTISIKYMVKNLTEGQTIEYYVDDPTKSVPIQGTKGIRVEQGTELKIDIPQSGTHVVGIRVMDAYGIRSEDARTFIYRNVHKPTLHVFAVGVNKYKYKGEGFKDLKYAVDDAKDFSKTIINLADMDTYKQVDTTLLLDGAANRANLEDQLIELTKRVQAHDVVMLFFSGHGVNINGDSYFLTADAKDPLRGLSFHFINQQIKDMKSRGGHILIFMDACHSGGMGNEKGSSSKSITLAEPGAIGYYSCTENQTSIEKEELKNGVFTYALIEGMKGNKYGQQITMWGLYNSILEIVEKENEKQYPRMLHDKEIDHDYVIFYKKK